LSKLKCDRVVILISITTPFHIVGLIVGSKNKSMINIKCIPIE